MPERCPFCDSHDVRPLTAIGVDLAGYRCHDCSKTFYAAAVKLPAEIGHARTEPTSAPGPRTTQLPRKRARRSS